MEHLESHDIISHHPMVNSHSQESEKWQSVSSYQQVNTSHRLPPPATRRLPPRSALKVVISSTNSNVHAFSMSSVSKNFNLQQERARQCRSLQILQRDLLIPSLTHSSVLVNLLQEKMKELIKLDTRYAFHLPGWNVSGHVDEFKQENVFDESSTTKPTHEIASVKSDHEVLTLSDLSRLMYRVCSVAEFKGWYYPLFWAPFTFLFFFLCFFLFIQHQFE
jgi:hypothetical protein